MRTPLELVKNLIKLFCCNISGYSTPLKGSVQWCLGHENVKSATLFEMQKVMTKRTHWWTNISDSLYKKEKLIASSDGNTETGVGETAKRLASMAVKRHSVIIQSAYDFLPVAPTCEGWVTFRMSFGPGQCTERGTPTNSFTDELIGTICEWYDEHRWDE